MYLQDEVPTVRKIQLGRGALMRPLKNVCRKQSWWVIEYGGLYFFWRESHLHVLYILLLGGIYVDKVRSAGHIF